MLKTNAPPVLDPVANQTVAEGKTLDIAIHAIDPNGDPIVLTATGLPAFAAFKDNGNGSSTIHVVPGPDTRSNSTVTIQATDNGQGVAGAELTTQTTFVLSVTALNEPPVLVAVGDKVAVIGQALRFSTSATDPDQDPLTYAADGLPAGATYAIPMFMASLSLLGRQPLPTREPTPSL